MIYIQHFRSTEYILDYSVLISNVIKEIYQFICQDVQKNELTLYSDN